LNTKKLMKIAKIFHCNLLKKKCNELLKHNFIVANENNVIDM